VEVDAELELAGRALDRVEFYWNSVLAGVRRAAPLRQTIQLGSPSASGWVRVVAWLGDGSSVEDALPLNLPGGGERVDVRLVQLQVVAADGERRPVRGLRREDFRLLEGNRERQISSFGDGSELPLTLALAIDTSASMFRKLPAVERAAGRFLGSVLGPRDRALVVGFGREAKVVAALGSELPALLRGVGTLEASGETGIWRAIAYTLAELESVPGRKAVVVYSDGVDQDADFRFASCLRLARRLGTPIYVILSNGELVRTGGRGLYVRPLLARFRRLTRAVGGHLYLARVDATLEHVYAEIAAELRSQYLLGFYAAAGDEEWRPLRVEVRRPGVEARTLEGYFR
jgi:Ca-activated chloride channel family protein